MAEAGKIKWRRTNILFWLLLVYIIAALVWWFVSLEKQNQKIRMEQIQLLDIQAPQMSKQEQLNRAEQISAQSFRNSAKYLSEGITFLIIILIGAFAVYRAVRRQLIAQQQQQQFMMAVTHELKTPIAVTRLNLETMQRYKLDPEKQEKLIRIALDETNRLNLLTNNILVSSQLENKGFAGAKEELDFSALAKDCMKELQNRFPDRAIKTNIEDEIDLKGDSLLLQILLNNLVENAIKYSSSPIEISLARTDANIQLQVADQGIGIPDQEKKKIFDRFYRIGNETTRTTKGTGLGLYLCDRIAHHHEATITVKDNHPTGSIFLVNFAV